MSLDLDLIMNTFIGVARDALDGQLSIVGQTGNQFPAVIRVRQTGPQPNYPYATLDILDISDGGEWLLEEFLLPNDDLVYENNKNLLLNFRIYGGNALNIANNLHGYFRIESVLKQIREDTTGAVVTISGIDSLPTLLPNTFLETASFNIVFAITDTLIIPDTGENYLSSIDLDGELFRDDEDIDPLPMEVIAP